MKRPSRRELLAALQASNRLDRHRHTLCPLSEVKAAIAVTPSGRKPV